MVSNNKLVVKFIPKYKCNALFLWARFQTKQNPLPFFQTYFFYYYVPIWL
jgi:hypothetical protein